MEKKGKSMRRAPSLTREGDEERTEWTPCCGNRIHGLVEHNSKCVVCDQIMLWCRGCGDSDGRNYRDCEICGCETCSDCRPLLDDDDAKMVLCDDCHFEGAGKAVAKAAPELLRFVNSFVAEWNATWVDPDEVSHDWAHLYATARELLKRIAEFDPDEDSESPPVREAEADQEEP